VSAFFTINIVRWYFANPVLGGEWTGTPPEGSQITFPVSIDTLSSASDNGKLFDSLWVEWTGGTLNFIREGGGTDTLPASPAGDRFSQVTFVPSDAAPVPAPATLAIFGLGLAGMAFALRRRRGSIVCSDSRLA